MLEFERINISEDIDGNKKNYQKNVIFATIGISKILVLRMNHIFAMGVTI